MYVNFLWKEYFDMKEAVTKSYYGCRIYSINFDILENPDLSGKTRCCSIDTRSSAYSDITFPKRSLPIFSIKGIPLDVIKTLSIDASKIDL